MDIAPIDEFSSAQISLRVFGKINLFLQVDGVESNGYHKLLTVFQPVDLYDDVHLSLRSSGDCHLVRYAGRVCGTNIFGDKDLCIRALNIFLDKYRAEVDSNCSDYFDIFVNKMIPVQGGMAGGSVDAAGVLRLLNEYYGFPFNTVTLEELAARLGADVPFGVRNVLSVGNRYGDVIEPLELPSCSDSNGIFPVEEYCWLLILNKVGLSTPDVFAELDRLYALNDGVEKGVSGGDCASFCADGLGGVSDKKKDIVCLKQDIVFAYRDSYSLAKEIRNDLEIAALSLYPKLSHILVEGIRGGALRGFISGSGPTCVLLCESESKAEQIRQYLANIDYLSDVIDEMLVVSNVSL
ncbi:4-(cytidine 5'-diphospho)-2-C-methyl-D-erythritol kinase [Actinomyces sp. zg-332]|uniref:4-(cytidine 5'-diphospho)-2-C-methyl-D-erythritol kinase n=1 Tax=Actinomyces sp. zg-332 TaxID=2708340 RepID=UPI0014208B03|nr:4-(cytidine 5'-diphospho)-2-C-methyl-D-erythritol kinase [Actinomyces sp. zg-332]QPK94291.1 4-(cytidine 5'-diphospho)-2-C-methyl-D-erythritol kinase [Actinomyces sp. zg-332]